MNLDDSMTVQLFAPLAGSPTGDLLNDALREVVMSEARCVAELTEVGFSTSSAFDYLDQHLADPRLFTVTSLATNTPYLILCRKRVGNTFQVVAQVYHEGKVNRGFHKMTFARAQDGSICATPGWQ